MHPQRLKYDIDVSHTFLLSDHFHLGVKPWEDIRHLRLPISPVHNSRLAIVVNDHTCISSKGRRIVKNSLGAMNLIVNKKGCRPTTVLDDGVWGVWTEQTMEKIRPMYQKLKDAGMHVRVRGKPHGPVHPIQRIDNHFRFSYSDWWDACTKAHGTGEQEIS
jgi:hypothetical protein